MAAPLVPNDWHGVDASEKNPARWRVSIQHDRFSMGEPFVVSLLVTDTDEGERAVAMACPSPTQAREMAAALLVYAHMAEQENMKWPGAAAASPGPCVTLPTGDTSDGRTSTEAST